MTVSPAKAAELIVMLCEMLTQMSSRNHALDAGPYPHTRRGNFEGEKVDILKVTQQGAESVRWGRTKKSVGQRCASLFFMLLICK